MNRDRQRRTNHARQLRAGGIALEIPADDWKDPIRESGLIIRQCDGRLENSVFDLGSGATGYVVSLSLTVSTSNFALAAFDLELPWQAKLNFLEDPRGRSKQDRYEFPNGDVYPRDVVINHCVDIRRILRCGQSIEGLLLGSSFESMPDGFVHGVEIPAVLKIFDQFYACYRSAISLWANRSQKLSTVRRKGRNRAPLFAEPDSIARKLLKQ
jgi:hypothetical protein